jgi:hypothetical protein
MKLVSKDARGEGGCFDPKFSQIGYVLRKL